LLVGVCWVGLGQSVDGLGWIGSQEMDPQTTLRHAVLSPPKYVGRQRGISEIIRRGCSDLSTDDFTSLDACFFEIPERTNRHTNVHSVLCPPTPKHKHTFNGPLSGTTQMSQYQNGKTNLDLTEARDSEWQWHQPDHMQICTSLQTNNHASTPQLSFYRPDALPAAQPTVSMH